ncbi:tRNA pseudouridine(55) synthase TruB [bacterium]|nr:tRNA pseudouridine(55) synthase TruB [bacterium]
MFGFLNVYKPVGMTSFDVIATLRKIIHIKQIGHTGTLDPFAQGVLPVCIGKATKLIEYLTSNKAYLATVQFGSRTDTYDREGQIVESYDKKVSAIEIEGALKDFEGEIEQLPPIYSAIKVNGKKLYDYARSGQEVEIKPRKVSIYKIEMRDFDFNSQSAKIYVECGGGTYIRSIANDLGQKLGCGGYLTDLIRIQSGMFNIDSAVKLEDLKSFEDVEKNLLNPINYVDVPKYNLSEQEKERVGHGMFIKNHTRFDNGIVFMIYSDKMFAIGEFKEGIIKPKKVFEVL